MSQGRIKLQNFIMNLKSKARFTKETSLAKAREMVKPIPVVKVCRLCQLKDETAINLFTDDFVAKIKFCTGVEFTENNALPSYICKQCLQDLNTAHKFKENCQKAYEKLKIQKVTQSHEPCVQLSEEEKEKLEIKQENDAEDENVSEISNISIFDDCAETRDIVKTENMQYTLNIDLDILDKLLARHNRNSRFQLNSNKDCDLPKKMHQKKRNREENICEVCGKQFKCRSSYWQHRSQHNPKKYHCNDCGYKTRRKFDLQKHVLRHLEVKDHKYKCAQCNKSFRLNSQLLSHVRRLHQTCACDICGKDFHNKYLKKKHMVVHTGEKRIKDKLLVRSNENPRFYCAICEIQLNTNKDFNLHKKMHLKEKNKKENICEVCGKQFKYSTTYLTHRSQHYPEKYYCNDCDYKTRNKSDLTKHVLIHLDVKKYKCSQCSQSFRLNSNLLSHVRRLHEKLKRCSCEICGKDFYDKCYLKRHMVVHTGEKRFQCEQCFNNFSTRKNWKKHLLNIHGVKIPNVKTGRRRQEI